MNKEVKTLSDLCSIRLGHPFRGKIDEAEDSHCRVIQLRDVNERMEIEWKSVIRTEAESKRSPKWLEGGDILIVARGVHNHVVHLVNVPENTLCSPHFYVVRPIKNSNLESEFLAWQLQQNTAQNYFKQSSMGSNLPSLSRSTLEKIPITVPPLKTQKTIIQMTQAALKEKQIFETLIKNRKTQIQAIASQVLG